MSNFRGLGSSGARRIAGYLLLGIAAGLLTLIFFELAEQLLDDELIVFDETVLYHLQQLMGTREAVGTVMRGITRLGDGVVQTVLLVVAALLFWFADKRRDAVILAVCLGGGWLLNYTLKAFFGRERPELEFLVEASGFSFPSGHAMVSICFYGMLGYLLYRYFRNRWRLSWVFNVVAVLTAMAIGISRIYLGVHFASDVIAGFAAGGIWLISCILSLKLLRLRR
ncbi:phosphatase PAP2 family protein [Paenibacillus sp. 1P07SE]|uniref:phosphatase PAP2 family protein n=1 Tax=Paenibacillus sp. 1P07SE TaxID=3132209 RepID=UPI0039A6DDFC